MESKENCIFVTSLDPLKLLQVFSEEDYEEIIEEWQRDYLGERYSRVERVGGTGDKGRDIICTTKDNDCFIYQCKHYNRKLNKSDILTEIGKCCYYCFKEDYRIPKRYYFVSPQGVTTQVMDLFNSPDNLKEELKINWKNRCRSKISSSQLIELEGDLLSFIGEMDFSIFNYVSPNEFIEYFKTTPHYTKRFGRLYKPRKLITDAPKEIREDELTYIKKILDAYSDHLGKHIEDEKKLQEIDPKLRTDFDRQRLYFYSAEYLAAHSRETYAPEWESFEKLKDEIYHAIIEEIEEDAKNGFERLKKVLKRAGELTISANNPLSSEVNIKDRKGVCHHLANEREDVLWKK